MGLEQVITDWLDKACAAHDWAASAIDDIRRNVKVEVSTFVCSHIVSILLSMKFLRKC